MTAPRLDEAARGVFPISATPFAPDGALDLASLDRLMDFYLARRIHGLTLLGIMGEAPKLTPAESRAVVRRALARVAGRVPVVVGVSNAELRALAALANDAMAAGAAGVMVAPAPGLAGDDALVDYMASVFAALDPATPVVYQDYPQATGVPLTVEAFHRMVDAFPRLVMLKHEDCPGLTKLGRIRAEAARAGRRRVSVLVGNNAIYYPQELARGADGAMTGFSYPEMLVEVYERFIAGDAEGAEDVFAGLAHRARARSHAGGGGPPGARPPRRTTRAPAQGLSARSSAQSGAITSTTARHSTSGSTGFARCARKPAASAMSRGCWPANAVTATAGTSRVFRCRATSRTSQ
jgi:4-hydroxy-tetrahydrodipicolinate synthase